MTQRNEPIQRGHRRALWLTIPVVLGLAACGGADEEPVSAPHSVQADRLRRRPARDHARGHLRVR